MKCSAATRITSHWVELLHCCSEQHANSFLMLNSLFFGYNSKRNCVKYIKSTICSTHECVFKLKWIIKIYFEKCCNTFDAHYMVFKNELMVKSYVYYTLCLFIKNSPILRIFAWIVFWFLGFFVILTLLI